MTQADILFELRLRLEKYRDELTPAGVWMLRRCISVLQRDVDVPLLPMTDIIRD